MKTTCQEDAIHTHTHTHTHTGILSSHKKIEILPFATIWMDLEVITLSEISQTEKDTYHIISLYVESKTKTETKITTS